MSEYVTPLSLRLGKVFIDFCIEKGISGENVGEVLKQAFGELANNFDLEVRVEKKRPAGIGVMLSEQNIAGPMIVV